MLNFAAAVLALAIAVVDHCVMLRLVQDCDRMPPADPLFIALSYRHRRLWWFTADEEVQNWHVSADVDGEHDNEVAITVGDIALNLTTVPGTGTRFTFWLV